CGYGKGNARLGLNKGPLKLTVSADGNTLSGTWFDVEANGNKGADRPITITRDCSPDKGKLCSGIAPAMQTLATAKQRVGSTALYQSLQQNLGAELGQLRNQLCDDKAALQQLGNVQNALDSLNYVPGQSNIQNNLALLHIQDGLSALNQTECGAAPPQSG